MTLAKKKRHRSSVANQVDQRWLGVVLIARLNAFYHEILAWTLGNTKHWNSAECWVVVTLSISLGDGLVQ